MRTSLSASYFFELRGMPFRDRKFVEISCSTIEHVGMDNRAYTGSTEHRESRPDDFLRAVDELGHVLREGGRLLLTVPFGHHENFGSWQQFDAFMLERLISEIGAAEVGATYYHYWSDGWQVASHGDCSDARYSRYAARLRLPEEDRRGLDRSRIGQCGRGAP